MAQSLRSKTSRLFHLGYVQCLCHSLEDSSLFQRQTCRYRFMMHNLLRDIPVFITIPFPARVFSLPFRFEFGTDACTRRANTIIAHLALVFRGLFAVKVG